MMTRCRVGSPTLFLRQPLRYRARPCHGGDRGERVISHSENQTVSADTAAIATIALPTTLTLAIEPMAALISTAFVGHLGVSQLAGVGVSLTLLNSITKLFNMPLLAIITTYMAASSTSSTTSLATTDDGLHTVLRSCAVLTVIVALVQTLVLAILLETGTGLRGYGLATGSAAYGPARAYLAVRVLGNAVGVAFFAMLGVFRGLQDTVSPLAATILFTSSSILLEYFMLFRLSMDAAGAAFAVVVAQCLGLALQLALLVRRHNVELGKLFVETLRGEDIQVRAADDLREKISMCGILMCRTSLVMLVYSSATSLIARSGVSALSAAHQIAFQLWLASSLLADSLAVAAQSLMAKSHEDVGARRRVGSLCLRYAVVLGCVVTAVLHVGMPRILTGFTSNPNVLEALSTIMSYVVLSQIVSSVAFVLDGIVYSFGAPGYRHATWSMLYSATVAVATMWAASRWLSVDPLTASWIGLVALMLSRAVTMFHFFATRM